MQNLANKAIAVQQRLAAAACSFSAIVLPIDSSKMHPLTMSSQLKSSRVLTEGAAMAQGAIDVMAASSNEHSIGWLYVFRLVRMRRRYKVDRWWANIGPCIAIERYEYLNWRP